MSGKLLSNPLISPLGYLISKATPKIQDATTPATPEPQTAIAPPPELAAPTAADPAAQAAAEEALKKAQKNKGRANTILNGTVGEDTTAKTLLGA